MKKHNTSTGVTEKMMKEMFARLLNIEVSPAVMEKLVPVIDGVSEVGDAGLFGDDRHKRPPDFVLSR